MNRKNIINWFLAVIFLASVARTYYLIYRDHQNNQREIDAIEFARDLVYERIRDGAYRHRQGLDQAMTDFEFHRIARLEKS